MSATVASTTTAGIDCSPEALAGYRRQLAELEAMYFGGAASVSDRNRSVTFRSHADLGAAITTLRNKIAICTGCARRRTGISYTPLVKAL